MLKLYNAAATFVLREKTLLGDSDTTPTQEAQVGHFIDSLPSFDRDVEDASSMYHILCAKDPDAFTVDQRKRIAKAISIHMRGVTAAVVASGDSKNQSHMYQYNYWSNQMWDDAWNKELSKTQIFSSVIGWYIVVGLRFANDETVKQTLAMIGVGRDEKNTPQQNYEDVHTFKRMLRTKRELYKGETTFKDFPESPDEFKRLYPDKLTYEPVKTRVDVTLLRELVHKDVMPSRSNNKNMNGDQSRAASSSQHQNAIAPFEPDTRNGTRPLPQRSPTASHLLQGMQRQGAENREFQERMMQFVMHGGVIPNGMGGTRAPLLSILGPPAQAALPAPDQHCHVQHVQQARPEPPLALADRVPAGGQPVAASTPSPAPAAAPNNLKSMIDNLHNIRSAIKPKTVMKSVMKAAKAKRFAVDSDDDQDAGVAASSDDPAPVNIDGEDEDEHDGNDDDADEHDDEEEEEEDEDDDDEEESETAKQHVSVKTQKSDKKKQTQVFLKPAAVIKRPAAATTAKGKKHAQTIDKKCKMAAAAGKKAPKEIAPIKTRISAKSHAASSGSIVVMKRPAAAPVATRPAPAQTPTAYNGGKIYFAAKKKKLRVYLKNNDRIEKTVNNVDFSMKNRLARQWGEALGLIDADRLIRD